MIGRVRPWHSVAVPTRTIGGQEGSALRLDGRSRPRNWRVTYRASSGVVRDSFVLVDADSGTHSERARVVPDHVKLSDFPSSIPFSFFSRKFSLDLSFLSAERRS